MSKGMMALTEIPVASALLGPVVGLASAKAVMSHFRCGFIVFGLPLFVDFAPA